MLLAIDVGNTHTVFGVYDDAQRLHRFRLATDPGRTADEYAVLLRALLVGEGIDLGLVDAAILASVVPPLNDTVRRMCRRLFDLAPLVVGPGIKTGMPILYDNPREVGADRIVNAVAGYERYRSEPGGPFGLIIVDFGTATTFDIVTPRGEYLGGAIAPGMMIAAEALFTHAAKLPRVDLTAPPSAIGKSTISSMQAGILFGYAGLVDGLVARIRGELDYEPRVMATGGLGSLVAEHTNCIERVDDDLTLDGLRIIYERNHHERNHAGGAP